MSTEATPSEPEATSDTDAAESYPGSEFNRRDIAEFTADDTEATANIGKMLTIFFGYSLLAMIVVTLWTVWVTFGSF